MNEREQQITIAEACGWYDCHCLEGGNIPFGKPNDVWNRDVRAGLLDQQQHEEELPDYLHDLNAMHEAEKTLCNGSGKHEQYAIELARLLSCNDEGESNPYDWWKLATATAAQRAEAFLRTIGKWPEPAPANPLASPQ